MSDDPRILPASKALYAHPVSNGAGKNAPEIIAQCVDAAIVALAAADHAAAIDTPEELDALAEGSVVLGWGVGGRTPYLRCRTHWGRLAWGCVGEDAIYESANLLQSDTTATVIHWGKA